jgi:hypothetical protein
LRSLLARGTTATRRGIPALTTVSTTGLTRSGSA